MTKEIEDHVNDTVILDITLFFYKQLGLGPSPQSCLYFQDFQGSKLFSRVGR